MNVKLDTWIIEVQDPDDDCWKIVHSYPDTDLGQLDALSTFMRSVEDTSASWRLTTPEPLA